MKNFSRSLVRFAGAALALGMLTGCVADPPPAQPDTTAQKMVSDPASWTVSDPAVREAVRQWIPAETALTEKHRKTITRLTITGLSSTTSLDELKNLPSLAHLQLVGGHLSSEHSAVLAELTGLKSLRLADLGVVKASFLKELPALKLLTLEDLLAVEDFALHPDATSLTVLP